MITPDCWLFIEILKVIYLNRYISIINVHIISGIYPVFDWKGIHSGYPDSQCRKELASVEQTALKSSWETENLLEISFANRFL